MPELNEEIALVISKTPAWSKASHEIIRFQFSLVKATQLRGFRFFNPDFPSFEVEKKYRYIKKQPPTSI